MCISRLVQGIIQILSSSSCYFMFLEAHLRGLLQETRLKWREVMSNTFFNLSHKLHHSITISSYPFDSHKEQECNYWRIIYHKLEVYNIFKLAKLLRL